MLVEVSMFGYVRPLESELKVREQARWRAFYCGLCRELQKRSILAPFTLTYDCSFLALLLSALDEEAPQSRPCRCLHAALDPKRQYIVTNAALSYAADVNILLAYEKCRDDERDEHSLRAQSATLALRGAYKRTTQRQVSLAARLHEGTKALTALEQANCKSPDEAAEPFAGMLRAVAEEAPDHGCKAALSWLLYNLGRYIYLADARDDLIKDAQRGSYNPFLAAGTRDEDARFMIEKSLDESAKALELLPLERDRDLLDNILVKAASARTDTLFAAKEKLQSKESKA